VTAADAPHLTKPRVSTHGLFEARMHAPSGRSVVVEGSTNVSHWLPLLTNTEDFPVADSTRNALHRFYRAILLAPGTNQPPAVSLAVSPEGVVAAPVDLILTATASDVEGPVTRVEFHRGPEKLGESAGPVFRFVWSNALAGNQALTARAVDNSNAVTVSSPVLLTVSNGFGVRINFQRKSNPRRRCPLRSPSMPDRPSLSTRPMPGVSTAGRRRSSPSGPRRRTPTGRSRM
jgi:hypothetical protein